ncbi:LD-carboxypeptidase [Sphingomonas sp. BN140010]|uniref:LD-carboxypeptidase n=1 Tax=Sphingomonas arvum TaxID=2992113 RepID=A0ABT3JHL8_9SPHN|nr:LD-carboxypeptidase [Sphingomonas sp. BN140010]MCW3798572.1 LD-carboxypeptidase [Sphingomonas sp. BN140010]
MRIAVVAPSCPLKAEAAEAVSAIVAARGDAELVVNPQCYLSDGHFAGSDSERLAALREVMVDPAVDAVWFARGGYGSNRIAEAAVRDLPDAARLKTFLGYSDGGFLLAALHGAGCRVAHGPMPQDVLRAGGEGAVGRALDWLVRRDPGAVEGQVAGPAFAFNLTVLSCLLGTALEPDFAGRELLVEEVDEEHYRIDRLMFHLTGSAAVRRCAGIRLGRCIVPENDRPFGSDEEAIVRDWCGRSGVPYLGRADIGHDAANKIVPFFLGV